LRASVLQLNIAPQEPDRVARLANYGGDPAIHHRHPNRKGPRNSLTLRIVNLVNQNDVVVPESNVDTIDPRNPPSSVELDAEFDVAIS
jgi:hypothetical protein